MILEPELSNQWHPELNLPLTIESLNAVSRKVWWLGECGHSFESSVFERRRGSGCGYCAGKKVLIGFNDLASQYPDVANEWHPTKNELTPAEVIKKTSKKFWWVCDEGHEWEARVLHRVNGSGCPVCANLIIQPGFNDLAATHPVLAAQWHPVKNGTLSPDQLGAGSRMKIWWLGECGHEWEARVSDRTKSGTGCHYCSGFKVLVGFNDLSTTHPEFANQWNVERNGVLSPTEVSSGSSQKVWWVCEYGHEWESSIASRVHGSDCQFCSQNVLIVGVNDLASQFPALAQEWHPTKNNGLTPQDVMKKSGRKVWWLGECGHEWESLIANRANGAGCPVCKSKKILPGTNDLATSRKGRLWHPSKNLPVILSEIAINSNQLYWWKCEYGHEWRTSPNSLKQCPYCQGSKVLVGFNDLSTKHPDLVKEWSSKNLITPQQITAGSRFRAIWTCGKHEWEAKVADRTHYLTGCPQCAANSFISKPEHELFTFLTTLGLDVIQSDRKALGQGQELDLYIPEKNFAVEFNGLYWHDENHKDRNYHYNKYLAAKQAGIQLLQIWEDDWRDRKFVILRALAHKLGLSPLLYKYDEVLIESVGKVFARKTFLRSLSTLEAQDFLNQHHVQGFASGSYYVGLEFENTIRAVLVLRKEPSNTLNIVRYATSAQVVGGFTKLLKYVERAYAPAKFITFADHTISDGGLYENNGFIADKELPPDYMYVIRGERKHKFGYRLKRFRNDPELLWEEGLSERELALLNNLPRIWDAGKTRYVKMV